MQACIGVLGGSFNPAHSGHLHVSREAKRRLRLKEVWWLVSPHNPLKAKSELADYAARLAGAKKISAKTPFIRVLDLEQRWGTRYTVDTLTRLKRCYPRARFIWLMGADNLASFHRWKRWQKIFQLVPLVIFDRAPYSHRALHVRSALRFAGFRWNERQLGVLSCSALPAWGYVAMRRDPTSSTEIRKEKTTRIAAHGA